MLSDGEIKILFYPLNKPGVFNRSNRNLKEQGGDGDTSSSSVIVSPSIVFTPLYVKVRWLFNFIEKNTSVWYNTVWK